MKLRIGGAVIGFLLVVLSLAGQTASSGSTSSQVPPLIPFSSVATDEGGSSLSGVLTITFSLYAGQQGGEPLWTETQNNIPLDPIGHYSVQLGITRANGVPTTLFTTGAARWLGVRIAEQSEQPRVLLLSVPYALKAGDAATIGGLPPSAFMLAAAAPGNNGSFAENAGLSGSSATPPTSLTVTTAGGTVNTIPLFSTVNDIENSLLTQSGTTSINVNGKLNLAPTGTATASKGFDSVSNNYTASVFNSSTAQAVTEKFLFQTEPVNNNTSTPSGSLHLLFGSGSGAPVETGIRIASNGQITFAPGQTFPGGGGTLTGITTAAGSGLTGGGSSGTLTLGLLTSCTSGQVLKWNGTAWACATLSGAGTVTSVASGAGLTGGPITGSGTLSIATGGVTNGMLATAYAQLGAANTFAGNQTLNGTLTTTSAATTISATTTNTGDYAIFGSGSVGGLAGSASSNIGVGVFGQAPSESGQTSGVVGVANSPSGTGVLGQNDASAGTAPGVYGSTSSSAGYGVEGAVGSSTAIGVFGSNSSTSGNAVGVYGTSAASQGYGVEGAGVYGVFGVDNSAGGTGFGVYGSSPGSGTGLYGHSVSGTGVYAVGGEEGVYGQGSTGVSGFDSAGNGFGVNGSSTNGYGVYGSSGYVGVSGETTTGQGIAILGYATNGGWGVLGQSDTSVGVIAVSTSNTAVSAENTDNTGNYPTMTVTNGTAETHNPVFQTSSPGTYSGSRHCTIDTSANLSCTGVVSGIAQQVNGKQTAIYAMQSAENWLEDAGSSRLSNGSVRIELDSAFAQTVNAEVEYHVFLTPNGDSKGLYVSHKTASSFEVHEQSGGTSSIAFDYRIMAKRRGYESVRLEDVTERFKQRPAPTRKVRAPLPQARPKPAPAMAVPLTRPMVAPRPLPLSPRLPVLPLRAAQTGKPEVIQK